MEDLFYRAIVVGALVVMLWLAYRWRIQDGYWEREHPDLIFDPDNPRDVHEAKCIEHQRTTGRERGGDLVWRSDDD